MSKFKLEDGIPVAQRDRASRGSNSSNQRLVARGSRAIAPVIVIVGGLTLTTAAIAGVFWVGIGTTPSNPDKSSPDDTSRDVVLLTDPAEATIERSTSQGSIFGHIEYDEADEADLRLVGHFNGRPERLHATAADRFQEMQADARRADINLVAISGFRSVEAQEYLFFQVGQSQSLTPQERALVSAPPGHSEHHTGYAIDIGDARHPQSHLDATFDRTPAFRWLETNAPRFGFELSFPKGNPYGVNYEPWHWRFVGDRASLTTFHLRNQTEVPQADSAGQ
ncbi:MAG: D-alanyl-D-alanine carboxypeptidase family protein [Synechococcus sp.]